jgi:hypothetical protein
MSAWLEDTGAGQDRGESFSEDAPDRYAAKFDFLKFERGIHFRCSPHSILASWLEKPKQSWRQKQETEA